MVPIMGQLNLRSKVEGTRGFCPYCSHPITCMDIDGRLSWRNPVDRSPHFVQHGGSVICSTKTGGGY